MQPRGIRNNNPLNIRVGCKWVGEVENPTDKDFEQFTCMHYGLRAGFILLRRYIERYHLCTITDILSRWAPNRENHTRKYIDYVCDVAGIGALDKISFQDADTMIAIVNAMCYYENGTRVPFNVIQEGYALACELN